MWELLNSPVGIAIVAAILLALLNRLYTAKPEWQKYEGAINTAIRLAEKSIPDDAQGGLGKLDKALKYVVAVWEETNGRKASKAVENNLKEGIQLVHARLEDQGVLGVDVSTKDNFDGRNLDSP